MNWSQSRQSTIPSTFSEWSSVSRTFQDDINSSNINSFSHSNSSSCSSSPLQPHSDHKSFNPNKAPFASQPKSSLFQHQHPKKQHLNNYNNQITKAEPDSTTQRHKLQPSPDNPMSVSSTFGSGGVETPFYGMLGTVRPVSGPGQLVGSYYGVLEHYASNADHGLDQSSYVAAVQQLQNNSCNYPAQTMFVGNFSPVTLDQSMSQYGLHSSDTNVGNCIHKPSLTSSGLIQSEYGMNNNNNNNLHSHTGYTAGQNSDYSRYTNFYHNSGARHPFVSGNFDAENAYMKEEPSTNLFPLHTPMNETNRMLAYQSQGHHFIPAKLPLVQSLPEQELTTYKETKEKRPCDVCSDVSAGFHCNAFVCEACKKFFIRSSKSNNFQKYSCSKSNNCDIVKDTRTHCQHCRYQKCLRLGMSLPGSNQPSGADISVIPCRVCGAQSSGFHFGAITCEGCKGFFRRTINERDNQKYTCSKGGSCVINITTRNNCKSCRYDTCVRVGMSKGGSRIGRQPNAVKHMCAIEIEKIKTTTQHTNSFLHPTNMSTHPSNQNSLTHHSGTNSLYPPNRLHASNYSISTSSSNGLYQANNPPSCALSPNNQLYVSSFGGSSNVSGQQHYLSPSYQSSGSHTSRDSSALHCPPDKYESSEQSGKVYTPLEINRSMPRIRKFDYEPAQVSSPFIQNNSRYFKDGEKERITFSGLPIITDDSRSPNMESSNNHQRDTNLPKAEMTCPAVMMSLKSPNHHTESVHPSPKRRCITRMDQSLSQSDTDMSASFTRMRHLSQSSSGSSSNLTIRGPTQSITESANINQSTEILKQNLVSVTIDFEPDMPEFSFLYHINQAAKELCQCGRRIHGTSPLPLETTADCSNESTLWKSMMLHFQAHAYQVINFARSLPGFYRILNNDRMVLVQEAMYPIILFQLARDFNPQTKEFNYFNFSKEERENILREFSNFQPIAEHLKQSGQMIKPFGLDDTETALICCIELLKGESDSIEDPHTIREIYDFAVRTFLNHTCKQSSTRGHDILDLLPKISQMNKEHQSIIMDLKISRPHLQFPELYIQMFQLEPGECNSK